MRTIVNSKAKSWELRAAISMARFCDDQGKRQEARDLLAPVYGWFTEGFDTRNLKDAKGACRVSCLRALAADSSDSPSLRKPSIMIDDVARSR
jgi:hypothetical protein